MKKQPILSLILPFVIHPFPAMSSNLQIMTDNPAEDNVANAFHFRLRALTDGQKKQEERMRDLEEKLHRLEAAIKNSACGGV